MFNVDEEYTRQTLTEDERALMRRICWDLRDRYAKVDAVNPLTVVHDLRRLGEYAIGAANAMDFLIESRHHTNK